MQRWYTAGGGICALQLWWLQLTPFALEWRGLAPLKLLPLSICMMRSGGVNFWHWTRSAAMPERVTTVGVLYPRFCAKLGPGPELRLLV